jgi:hypothetical protein
MLRRALPNETIALVSRPNEVSSSPSATGARWFYAYLLIQIACQLALLVPTLATARIVFRVAAFGSSLAFLLLVRGRSSGSALERTLLAACLGILALSALNPEGGGLLASFAQWTFHLAIVAPVFWGSRLHVSPRAFEKIVLILWAFATASAFAGVLQAVFPGRFQPSFSTLLAERGPTYVSAMSIQLASGEWVLRPMGLTDIPGGAASGGLYAVLLGVGVILARPFPAARVLGIVAAVAGMTCLYLSQVRSMVLMVGICLIALVAVLAFANRLGRMVTVLSIGGALAFVGFATAFSLGGSSMSDRLQTLTQDSPTAVYYRNRGIFLEHTFVELIAEYPLGAGLGRWGMMTSYFGEPSRALWAEIQWTGWLYDGGLLLIVLYPVAVVATLWQALRIARRHARGEIGIWAALVAAYDVGTIALLFSYPVFMSTGGLEFWLLNTALMRAAAAEEGENQLLAERPS